MIKIFLSLLIFLLGIYFIFKAVQRENEIVETFDNKCPNMLIQDGNKIMLYNDKKAKIPGVNPIVFNNLEEYVQFMEFHRSQKIRCPILHYQKVNNTQGEEMYEIKPSSLDDFKNLDFQAPPQKHKLIDASRDDPPYNDKSYPGYDEDNQYVGIHTDLNDI